MFHIVDNDIRALAQLLASRPGLQKRIMVNNKIDRELLRIELAREYELHGNAINAEQNGLRPRVNHGGGPGLHCPSPSPWARDHPKWDPK